ncbi:porin [Lutibacter sp. A64]|uniref:OprO/OprP family phosphate-selective porin n=1 Tax=Lutibacter sp. A64 TaxID=2918526 RepID=UPI001F0681D3|nr:porin [Lutibacter sp. A64]UMB52646.1 porin [Lutibacter sp. A64]
MKSKVSTLVVALILFGIGLNAQEKKDNIRINQYGQEVEAIPLHTEAQDGFIKWFSEDGNYKMWMDNRAQLDAYIFSNDALNELGNGITIRRMRFALKAEFWKNWYGEIDLDFESSGTEIKDAYLKYTADSKKWDIKAGHFKEGYGMETTTTSRYLLFMERSLASTFDPSRHLGFQTNIYANKFLFVAGVHFNTVGDAEEVTITKDANKDDGVDEGYSLTGRAVWAPINDNEKLLHLGVAATHRTPKTYWEGGAYRLSTRSHSVVNRKKFLDTDDISGVDNVFGYTFELAGKYKGVMFQGEYKEHNVNMIDGIDASFKGYYAQAAYLLLGGKHNYNTKEGEFTRITPGSDKGDIELALRYDFIDLNDFDASIYGGSAEGYSAGLNYYVNPNVKVALNYVYHNHDRFANGKGKLYVGHDASGNPTKDWSLVTEAEGDAGDDYGQVSLRLEVNF